MTDRLEEIKRALDKNWQLGKEDSEWLIRKVEWLWKKDARKERIFTEAMTTDPVERVARAYYEATDLGIFEMDWDALSMADREVVTTKVRRFFGVLEARGIPLGKLLSGEMVAVHRKATSPGAAAFIEHFFARKGQKRIGAIQKS